MGRVPVYRVTLSVNVLRAGKEKTVEPVSTYYTLQSKFLFYYFFFTSNFNRMATLGMQVAIVFPDSVCKYGNLQTIFPDLTVGFFSSKLKQVLNCYVN